MTGGQPRSDPVLTQDLWQLLFTQALLFATKYIDRLRWRGNFAGVLPDGDDAESIAALAVITFLQQQGGPSSCSPVLSSPGPLSCSPLSCSPVVRRSLSRLVWRHVDRLHHRSENRLLRNEPNLARAYSDDGEPRSIIETMRDPAANPRDYSVHKETAAEFESLRTDFRKFLGRDRRLKSLLTCYENGLWRPRDIAARLHLSIAATRNLQKRLKRRLHQFLEQRSHAE